MASEPMLPLVLLALALPANTWVLMERSEISGDSIWAKRLEIKDAGLPVVLLEEKPGSRKKATIRFLVTVDCVRQLQAIRQFWQSGEPRWLVVSPLEWVPPGDAKTVKLQALACSAKEAGEVPINRPTP